MEVFKRPRSSYWSVDYVNPITKLRQRVSLRVKGTKAAATKAAAALLLELEAEAKLAKDGKPPIKLGACLDRYIDYLRRAGKASADNAARTRDKTLGIHGFAGRFSLSQDLWIHDLTPHMTGSLRSARQNEGNGPQTIKHELQTIRAACRHASGDFRVPVSMLDGSIQNAWRIPEVGMKTRYLSLQEFRAVYAYLDPHKPVARRTSASYQRSWAAQAQTRDVQDLLVALAMIGGRWSEIATLRWDRVDTAALRQWADWDGQHPIHGPVPEQRPTVTIRLWGSKTQRERLLGCSDLICKVLYRRWLGHVEAEALVFPGQGGGRRNRCHSIQRAIDGCGLNTPERVGEAGRATIHSLRHTFASLLLQNGASLADIQGALGHTTMAMTARYSHLERTESAAKLANIMTQVMT